jgi:hypothetical protein
VTVDDVGRRLLVQHGGGSKVRDLPDHRGGVKSQETHRDVTEDGLS